MKKKNSFNKEVLVLTGGTTIAQFLLMLMSPVISRLYTPEEFGVLGVYISLLSFFSIISTLKFEIAIPLPKKDQDSFYILIIAFSLTIITSLILSITFYFFSKEITSLLNISNVEKYLWLIPIGILMISSYNILSFWAIRKKQFLILSKTKLTQSISSIFSQIILGILHFSVYGLIIGQIIGQSSGTITLLSSLKKARISVRQLNFKGLIQNFKKYKDFPKYTTFSTLINTLSTQAPPLLFAILFTPAIAGFYVMAQKIVTTPMNIIGTSISKVFHANAIHELRKGTIHELGLSVLKKLTITGFIPLVLLYLIAPDLFSIVFGEKWLKAGEYVKLLTPWLLLVFIGSPLSNIIFVINKQKQNLFFHFILFVGRILALFIGYKLNSDYIAVLLFSLVSFLIWLIFLIWLLKLMSINFKDVLKIFTNEIILAFIIIIGLFMEKNILTYLSNSSIEKYIYITSVILIGIYLLIKRILPIWKI